LFFTPAPCSILLPQDAAKSSSSFVHVSSVAAGDDSTIQRFNASTSDIV
jgi:hypothetical protein